MRAFVLGAGLGKRLRPLTDLLPKPLIPVWHRPLIEYAFDHLRGLGVNEFVVNTHHLPQSYTAAFPESNYAKLPIHFRHEPVLLETGGGLANVADLLSDEPCAVYNGDILTDIPLQQARDRHFTEGNLVTLVLRSGGQVRNVAFDHGTGMVLDLRNTLGKSHVPQYQFTGLYFINPGFFRYLSVGVVESVVEGLLRAIVAGEAIGGIVIDEGHWWDLGDAPSYLAAHSAYQKLHPVTAIHPSALISPDVQCDETSCIGTDCRIGTGSKLTNTILWPEATIGERATLGNCIVRPGAQVTGQHRDAIV